MNNKEIRRERKVHDFFITPFVIYYSQRFLQ